MKRSKWTGIIIALLCMSMLLICVGCGPTQGENETNGLDEDWTNLTVREATGKNGVVTSANAYASKAGLNVLNAGGNAFDAAVATAFALGVVEPYASGIGGGGVMTAYDASSDSYKFYNFREFVPQNGTYDAFMSKGGKSALESGITAVGVPTEVAGLTKIYDDLGSGNVTLAQVLAPAIDYAENGFTIEGTLAGVISDGTSSFRSKHLQEAIDVFLDAGISPYTTGDTLVQENYAKVLKEIAQKGSDGFYKGWVADAIVNAMIDQGGFVTKDDLAYAQENYPIVGQPLHGSYNGYDLYTSNLPSSGGVILVETLNMLEHYCQQNNTSLSAIGNNTTEYAHLLATAMQLSYADKRHYVADNAVNPLSETNEKFNDVPLVGLMNKNYAAQRFDTLYNPDSTFFATSSYDWGGAIRNSNYPQYANDISPWEYQNTPNTYTATSVEGGEHYSTTSFSVADKDGNIVSFTQTINHFWGAYAIPEGTGFFLNNQLSSFSTSASSVHYVMPYKQPVSHIMPTIVMKDGLPFATFGSPGSTRIPSAVIQVALNLMDFDMGMQQAIANGRIFSYAVSTADEGYSTGKKLLEVEKGTNLINETVISELQAKNYYVKSYSGINLYFGGVQGIKFNYDAKGNLINLTGGADPRRDGKALAY